MENREGKYELYLDGRQKTSIGANQSEEVYINADALRLPISENDTQVVTHNGQIRFNSETQSFQIYLNEWLDLATTRFVSNITTEDLGIGWARYDDTAVTETNKLTVLDGETTVLPNNGGNTIETHLHSSVSYYDPATQKMQSENNADVYIVTVVFKYSAPNANQTYLRVSLNSTGATEYTRVGKDISFAKGNDVTHDFHEVFQYYSDEEFKLNGNQWHITPTGGSVDIWDVIYFVQRTQAHSL